MNDKFTFWSPQQTARDSASLFLSFFKMMSYLNFLKVVMGNSPESPFSFTNTNGNSVCYYSLNMDTVLGPNSKSVFASVVSSLLNGTAGTIVPTQEYVSTHVTMYCPTVCSEQLLLESNCSGLGAAFGFWGNVTDLIANDKVIEAIKNCGSSTTSNGYTLPPIVSTTSYGYTLPIVLAIGFLVVVGVWALRNLNATVSPENQESDLEEGGQQLVSLRNS